MEILSVENVVVRAVSNLSLAGFPEKIDCIDMTEMCKTEVWLFLPVLETFMNVNVGFSWS